MPENPFVEQNYISADKKPIRRFNTPQILLRGKELLKDILQAPKRKLAAFALTATLALSVSPLYQPEDVRAQENCTFTLGFKALRDQIPGIVGDCREDEWHNAENGDGLQQTTGGLLVWRKADNWTAFTNGSTTWINGPEGLASRPNSGPLFSWEAPPTPKQETPLANNVIPTSEPVAKASEPAPEPKFVQPAAKPCDLNSQFPTGGFVEQFQLPNPNLPNKVKDLIGAWEGTWPGSRIDDPRPSRLVVLNTDGGNTYINYSASWTNSLPGGSAFHGAKIIDGGTITFGLQSGAKLYFTTTDSTAIDATFVAASGYTFKTTFTRCTV